MPSEKQSEGNAGDRKPLPRLDLVAYAIVALIGGVLWLMGEGSAATGKFLLGVVCLLTGGGWLVDGAIAIAARMKVPTLVIGLTIVAFGTSAPELALNVFAAIQGVTDLSFGNVVGSNIANIALVLGIAAMLSPIAIQTRVIVRELPLLLFLSLLFAGLAWSPPAVEMGEPLVSMHGWHLFEGIGLLAAFGALLAWWYRVGVREPKDILIEEIAELEESVAEEHVGGMGMAAVMVLFGAALLASGGELTQRGAMGMAVQLGMAASIVGLTVVAIATSLPEVITSLIASVRGENDLAVGNVIGSNLFNMLLVMGVTACIHPVPLPEPGGKFDLIIMLGFTVGLLVLALVAKRLSRGLGMVLLMSYATYLAWTVLR